jgi:hypothetical protein
MNADMRLINPRVVTSRKRRLSSPSPLDLEPATAYEAITRQRVESLEDDLREIKSRVDTIFYLVIGSILVDMLTRWVG